jgi:hypothetical protein
VCCAERAGIPIHGTTAQRLVELFAEVEASCLSPVPAAYDVPVFTRVKVHRDFHVEVAKTLYSVSADTESRFPIKKLLVRITRISAVFDAGLERASRKPWVR